MGPQRTQPFRLVERGGAGLTCDADGISLGGIPLASVDSGAEGPRRYLTRPASEIAAILSATYGPQRAEVVQRCHRGLRRAASALEAQDLALADIETVMLRLPDLDADAMAKLTALADLEKGGDSWQNEPRVPAGQPEGGQWMTGGAAGGAPSHGKPTPPAPDDAAPGEITVTPGVRESRHQNANGFFPNTAGGGTFYIPSVSAGQQVRPTEVHALDANAFHVGWSPDGVIRLKDASGDVYTIAGNLPAIEHFNATTGRTLGVNITAFPIGKPASPDPATSVVDVTNTVAGALVDVADWLQHPAAHAPILPEIAENDSQLPMGAAWAEITDPNAFEAWRPVSHLEIAADALSVAGAVAPATRLVAGGDAAMEVAVEGESSVIQLGGAYRDVRGIPGYEAHHMPADSASPLSTGEGPSIAMKAEDHQLTATWGNSREARAARQAQADLIKRGDFRAAQQTAIQDVQAKFGNKYDGAIQQLLKYSKDKELW